MMEQFLLYGIDENNSYNPLNLQLNLNFFKWENTVYGPQHVGLWNHNPF